MGGYPRGSFGLHRGSMISEPPDFPAQMVAPKKGARQSDWFLTRRPSRGIVIWLACFVLVTGDLQDFTAMSAA